MLLKLDRNTDLAVAVDVMMARGKKIYILMIKINKFFFLSVGSCSHSISRSISQTFICVSATFRNTENFFYFLNKISIIFIFLYHSRFGRKKTIIAYSILSGICVVAVSLIPHKTNSIGNKQRTWISCSDNLDWN